MKSITKNLFESLNESVSGGNTIKEYAMTYLDGYIDNDVTDTDIDMLVAFSFDFNEEPDADFKAYSDFMNLIAERTKIVKVQKSSYGDTLVCDFSSVFKPYNEQLKEFFNMDNSEFDEDEAYYEAVDNLEALISGNAGDSTYNELISILNGKQVTNEADNLESTIDEAARYLFDEGDSDYLPDYEEFNDTTMEISKDLFDKAKERALEALTNLAEHQYYDHDGGYGTVLELNDNHTMWELTNENKSDEEWASIVQSKLAQFKADTGVDLMLLGRMGRHACVEPTYDNCLNFTYLQETQEKLEQEAIDEFNAEEMNESLSPNSGRKYVSKNVYVMNYKGTYIVLYHGHNEKEFDNETDAFNYAKKLAKDKNEELKESIDVNDENSMEAVRDYVKNNPNGGSILFRGFANGKLVYDIRIYPNGDTCHAMIEEYYINDDGEYEAGPKYDLENFDINMSDREVLDSLNNQLGMELTESIYTTGDGTPADIVADNIMHADSDPRFQTKEQVSDEKLCADLADFALETTDEEYWLKYSDEGYYEKNKRDYMKQINDINFVKDVIDLLETRLRNLDGVDEEYDTESLLAEFKEKLSSLEKPMNESEEQLYVYSNAESEDKTDAESMIEAQYKHEAPNLTFKMHTNGNMWFVDFIGKKEDIIKYLKELGWYDDEEIEEYDLIKPYKEV